MMPTAPILCQSSKGMFQKGSGKTTKAQLLRMQQLPLTRRVSQARCQTLLIPSKQQPLLCATATRMFFCQIIHTLSGMYSSLLEASCELAHTHRHKHKMTLLMHMKSCCPLALLALMHRQCCNMQQPLLLLPMSTYAVATWIDLGHRTYNKAKGWRS